MVEIKKGDRTPVFPIDEFRGTTADLESPLAEKPHYKWLVKVLEAGLFNPPSDSDYTEKDLRAASKAVGLAAELVRQKTGCASSPVQEPKIIGLLNAVSEELELMSLSYPSEFLQPRSYHPQRETLRILCVGFTEILALRTTQGAAHKIISKSLKKAGLSYEPKTVRSWNERYRDDRTLREIHAGHQLLSQQREHYTERENTELQLDEKTSLRDLKNRLDYVLIRIRKAYKIPDR